MLIVRNTEREGGRGWEGGRGGGAGREEGGGVGKEEGGRGRGWEHHVNDVNVLGREGGREGGVSNKKTNNFYVDLRHNKSKLSALQMFGAWTEKASGLL